MDHPRYFAAAGAMEALNKRRPDLMQRFNRHYGEARQAHAGQGRKLDQGAFVEAVEYACLQLNINPETGEDINTISNIFADEYDDIIRAQELLENPAKSH